MEFPIPLAARRVRYALVALVAGTVLVASVVETGGGARTLGPFGLVGADKWTHALAYAGLTAALVYAAVDGGGRVRLALPVIVAIAVGIAIELIQWPIPYRTASIADGLADAVGAGLFALGWRWLARFIRFVPTGEPT
jgi:hypothetical protein